MEPREFEAIDQFLKVVEKGDLFEYYGVAQDAPDALVEEAIKRRRTWAQGQQSNPKFRGEALWLIKHMALIRRALMEERPSYLSEVGLRAQRRNLERLTVFIEGTLADGRLTPAKQAAIREQGQKLGLPPARVEERLQQVLAARGSAPGLPSAPLHFVDHYQILKVPADADDATIEEAHRARYREARSLHDTARASELYAQLDEAWRVLKDPERRAEYDQERNEYYDVLERRAAAPDAEFGGFLPPPPKRSRIPEPRPSVPETTSDTEPVVLTAEAKVVDDAPPPRQPPRPSRTGMTPPPLSGATSGGGGTRTPPPVPLDTPPPLPASAISTPTAPRPDEASDEARGSSVAPGSGPFSPARRQHAPLLEVDSPDVHRIRAGRTPVVVRFIVRNAGQGAMGGRVLSDRDWVQVSPARLDPTRRDQVIEARVLPSLMPRKHAISLVTVVADHGERRGITIDVERSSPRTLLVVGVGVIAVLGVLGAIAVLMF